MVGLSGKELWKVIEKAARKKYNKDESWELTLADIKGHGIVFIRLKQMDGGVVNGFVEMGA